jgi:Tfp pilus assembly protein PilN
MISLLPPESKTATKYARLNVTLIQYCILVIAISGALLAIIFFGMVLVNKEEKDLKAAIAIDQAEAAKLEAVNSEAKELSDTVNTISKLLGREVKFSELLVEIGSILPKGTVLTGLTLSAEQDQPLTLDALVVNEEAAAILRENLADSELFEAADIVSIAAGETDSASGTYGFTAQYRAYFTGVADAKKKQAAENEAAANKESE